MGCLGSKVLSVLLLPYPLGYSLHLLVKAGSYNIHSQRQQRISSVFSKAWLENCTQTFHYLLTDQSSVTWPNLAERSLGNEIFKWIATCQTQSGRVGGQLLVPTGGCLVKETSQYIRASQDHGWEWVHCYLWTCSCITHPHSLCINHVTGYFQVLLKAELFIFHQQTTLNRPLPDTYLELKKATRATYNLKCTLLHCRENYCNLSTCQGAWLITPRSTGSQVISTNRISVINRVVNLLNLSEQNCSNRWCSIFLWAT